MEPFFINLIEINCQTSSVFIAITCSFNYKIYLSKSDMTHSFIYYVKLTVMYFYSTFSVEIIFNEVGLLDY